MSPDDVVVLNRLVKIPGRTMQDAFMLATILTVGGAVGFVWGFLGFILTRVPLWVLAAIHFIRRKAMQGDN